jgi:hypothetical protein
MQRLIGTAEKFKEVDWSDIYPDAAKDLPPNAPETNGNLVQINCFVDADHAGNKVMRQSHLGILIFLNSAPIDWYSKRLIWEQIHSPNNCNRKA